jgi:hypothetical protein
MTSSDERGLYAVRLLFEATHPNESSPSQMWEERIVVMHAIDEAHAEQLARGLPESNRVEYKNAADDRVAWELTDVVDVVQLLDPVVGDGTEVYYALHNRKSVEALRRAFRLRG